MRWRDAATRPEGLSVALSIAADQSAPSLALILDSLIRSRSVVLDELGARRSSIADPRVASASALLTAKRQRYANLMLRSMEGSTDSVTARLLDEAAREREDAERELATESVEFRAELGRQAIGLDEVRRALPPQTALISFVRYSRTLGSARVRQGDAPSLSVPARAGPSTVSSYLAFVLRPDQVEPVAISLGSAAILDRTVQRWRQAMMADVGVRPAESGALSFRAQGVALRRLAWDPLAEHLTDATRVFIVPDGDLNLVLLRCAANRRHKLPTRARAPYSLRVRGTRPGDALDWRRRRNWPARAWGGGLLRWCVHGTSKTSGGFWSFDSVGSWQWLFGMSAFSGLPLSRPPGLIPGGAGGGVSLAPNCRPDRDGGV